QSPKSRTSGWNAESARPWLNFKAVHLRARARSRIDSSIVDLGGRAAQLWRLQSGKFRSRISWADPRERGAGSKSQRSRGRAGFAACPSDALRIPAGRRRRIAPLRISLWIDASTRRLGNKNGRSRAIICDFLQQRRYASAPPQ